MAFAKAQDILLCQLCETSPKIKWKCIDCQLLMCVNCRSRIHPKFKNAEEHEIIALKEVECHNTESGRKLDLNGIKCKHHPDQICCLFCVPCDTVLCPRCLNKAHNRHKCIEINKAYDSKLEKLKLLKTKTENDKRGFTEAMQKFGQLQTTEDSKCERVVQEIQDQRDLLKQAVDHNADKLLTVVQHRLGEVQDYISGEKAKLQTSMNHLEDQTKKINTALDTNEIGEFFVTVDLVEKSIEEPPMPINLAKATLPKFIPSQASEICLGLLQDNFETNRPDSKVQIKVNKEFSTQMKHVFFLSVCPDNALWMGDSLSNMLHKGKLNEQKSNIKPISIIKTTLRGISLTPSGDLLFSDAGTKLKKISARSGKQLDSIYSVAPLLVMHIHISHDEMIIVSAITDNEGESLYPATGRRVVIAMDMTGIHKTVYEYDSNNERLFTYPRYLSSTRTGSIGVVDTISSDTKGRVVVLRDGNVANIYTGHPDINTKDKPFQPQTITTTPTDNLIVADMNRHVLQILDSFGCLITVCNMKDHGIKHPNSLAYGPNGQLYIGCSPPINNPGNAKIFEVVLHGC